MLCCATHQRTCLANVRLHGPARAAPVAYASRQERRSTPMARARTAALACLPSRAVESIVAEADGRPCAGAVRQGRWDPTTRLSSVRCLWVAYDRFAGDVGPRGSSAAPRETCDHGAPRLPPLRPRTAVTPSIRTQVAQRHGKSRCCSGCPQPRSRSHACACVASMPGRGSSAPPPARSHLSGCSISSLTAAPICLGLLMPTSGAVMAAWDWRRLKASPPPSLLTTQDRRRAVKRSA